MSQNHKWYRDGLNFTCTKCGNCCTGFPGSVWVNGEERRRIAAYLEMELEEFIRLYTHRVDRRYSLNEGGEDEDYDCVFLEEIAGQRVCRIYPVRPTQCRTWPFWGENLKARTAWEFAAQRCPGMNRGSHHDLVQIEIQRRRRF